MWVLGTELPGPLEEQAVLLTTEPSLQPQPIFGITKAAGFIACDLVIFVFVFQDRVSLSNSPGCPGAHHVGQAGLQLTEIHLPLLPEFLGLKV